MAEFHYISNETLSIDTIYRIISNDLDLALAEEVKDQVATCRNYLDNKIENGSGPVYGVNTGFGSLYSKNIKTENLEKLQENLVKSHACGVGPKVDDDIVQLMLLLKVQSLAYGNSGAQVETIERLISLYNHKIYPVVYRYGSLGASGDLAPLAHLSLPLLGLGEVAFDGKVDSGKHINATMNWEPIHLKAKEGLALLNGTQFMSAFGVHALLNAKRILTLADVIGALSLEAFDGRIEPFWPQVHQIRPHQGQKSVAAHMLKLLANSEIAQKEKEHVQDPYSFRCIPQVHGASLDSYNFVLRTFETEINSVSDNPNVFPEEDLIISAGNFHGQPLALALDYLAIALAEVGNISERRTFQLISGSRGLPNYLVANPGLNSGLMMPQYAAASLVSKNKELAVPSSTDSIVSSNGQEDHVSMGANAATKTFDLINNLYSILAIELLTAAQALHFRRPLRTSLILEQFYSNFREQVSFIENDKILHTELKKAEDFIKSVDLHNLSE